MSRLASSDTGLITREADHQPSTSDSRVNTSTDAYRAWLNRSSLRIDGVMS